jgi:DNA-binding MarR family transcriptional regulator
VDRRIDDAAFDAMIAAIYIVQVTVTDFTAVTPAREDLLRDIAEGIATLASRRRCTAARRIHHSGISLGHLQILWILQEHGPLPVSRLAEWLGIGVSNATGLLDRMEQRGLVERVRDADDRRVVLARMTEAGREAVAEHDGWRLDLVQQLLEPLPTDQLLAIAAGVRRARVESGDPTRTDPTTNVPATDPASSSGLAHPAGAPTR